MLLAALPRLATLILHGVLLAQLPAGRLVVFNLLISAVEVVLDPDVWPVVRVQVPPNLPGSTLVRLELRVALKEVGALNSSVLVGQSGVGP